MFGIATGRDRSMTVHGIEKWGISFDFLVCHNGAVVYDEKFTILTSRRLPVSVAKSLLSHPAAAASIHWQLCIDGSVMLYLNSERSWFPQLGVPYVEIDDKQAPSAIHIHQISFRYDTDTECKKWGDELAGSFPDSIILQKNTTFMGITGANISKATGIRNLTVPTAQQTVKKACFFSISRT